MNLPAEVEELIASLKHQIAVLQMFVEKREVKYVDEFAKLSNVELVELLEREPRLLLEDQSGGGHNDGNGDRGA